MNFPFYDKILIILLTNNRYEFKAYLKWDELTVVFYTVNNNNYLISNRLYCVL